MQVLNTIDPTRNFARFLVGIFDRVNIDGGSARHVLALNILQFQYCLVFVIKARFVKNGDTEVFLVAIGLGHLQESIDLSDSGDVVGDEGLDLGIELNLLGLIATDVLEDFLKLGRNGQVSVLVGVVCTWHFLFILVVIVIISALLLHLLLELLLRCLLLLLLLSLGILLNIHVDLIFLFVGVDFFGVVHIDG